MNANYKPLTRKQEAYLLDNYLKIPVKRMAREIGLSSTKLRNEMKLRGLVVPKEIIEQHRKESYFKKGHVPENKGKRQVEFMSPEAIERTKKTRFTKGHLPHNTKSDGKITIRQDHQSRSGRFYKWIRLSKGKWQMLSHYVWEQANGPIPEGHMIWFKDGNSLNCDLSNLEMITNAENMLRNSRHKYPKEVIPTMVLLNKLNKKLKTIRS